MAALLLLLTALLARTLEQSLRHPGRQRDPGPRRGGQELGHVGLGDADAKMGLLARRGRLPALDAICHGRQRIPSARVAQARDRAALTLPESDEQSLAFVRAFVHAIRNDTVLDQEQAHLFMRAILRRIVDEQITAIECLGGLGGWSRDSLSKLLSDTAEIESVSIIGAFAEAFASEMGMHTEPSAEPMIKSALT